MAPYTVEYFHPRVLAQIERWPGDVLADYARLVELLVEHGPHVRMPHSRSLGDGLFELRPRGRSGVARAMYGFVTGRRIVIVHAFIKKSAQTPDRDLAIARKRIKELSDA